MVKLFECLLGSLSTTTWTSVSDNDLSNFLRFFSLDRSSFSSIMDSNVWIRLDFVLPGTSDMGGVEEAFRNFWIICTKYITRAMKQATPHRRYRPQKLRRWSWSDSSSVLTELQELPVNHLSLIRWRSPFSERVRIAVDKSIARGESRGNAYMKMMPIRNDVL